MKVQTTTVLSILLTGCAVGPNYHRPLVSTPGHWTASNAQGTSPEHLLMWINGGALFVTPSSIR